MPAPDAALAHYDEQERITEAAVSAAAQIWSNLDPGNVSGSWQNDRIGDAIFLAVARSQEVAALSADDFTDLVLLQQGIESEPEGQVIPSSLAGVASDGRSLEDLLLQPVITSAIGRSAGMTAAEALSAGLASLTRIVGTQVQDAGRAATSLAVATRPRVGYVRMVNPGACSRCVILAGRFYRWSSHFERHPLCKCRNIPAAEDTSDDIRTGDPLDIFNSLSETEQNRQFTKAGAQAIRDGADIYRVVNARRSAMGLSAPGRLTAAEQKMLRGGREQFGHLDRVDVYGRPVYITREATTVRSDWGKAEIERFGADKAGRYRVAKSPRLMPESVYELAANREDAIRLLRRFGFIR